MLKRFLKKLLPKPLLSAYHYCLAILAAIVYRFPSRKLIVVGVTGTTGKTTTSYLIAQLAELASYKVGLTSTTIFKIAEKEWMNDKKMTMLGRWQTQKLLRRMVRAGCRVAVVETSSEGMLQHRHVGVHYDTLVFTNLSPEHLEAHGNFLNYKNTKLSLFKNLEKSRAKKIKGQIIPRTIIANLDDDHAQSFLNFRVDKRVSFSLAEKFRGLSPEPLIATAVEASPNGLKFEINLPASTCADRQAGNYKFTSPLLGKFNVYNLLGAIAAVQNLGVDLAKISQLLPAVKPCPGRIELINEGQDFTIIVDYAFEPKALQGLYQTIEQFKKPGGRVIQVLGGTGGGRDKARRPILGALAGEHANIVVVTTDDPYDDDPLEIINQVVAGAKQKNKIEGQNLFKILDRREGISKALSLAKKDDIVLITGKGSEQVMAVKNGQLLPWDDRTVAREELKRLDAR